MTPVRASLAPWSRPVVQAKLTVSAPGDAYEREADRVADQVMRMPEGPVDTPCACGGSCPRCSAEPVQREAMPAARPAGVPQHDAAQDAASADLSSAVAHGTSGGGHALDGDTRAFMEARFGRSFGGVRVHADGAAAQSAHAVGAIAYTTGPHIVFGAGRYAPGTAEGRRLLAHELAHTVQQGAATQIVGRSAIPGLRTGARGLQRAVITCAGKSKNACKTPKGDHCVPASGGTGFCKWSGAIDPGCVCYPFDQPGLSVGEQILFTLVIMALMAAAFVITEAMIGAIIVCLSGPCEFGALVAVMGFAAALIVIGVIKASKGSSAGPNAAAGGGDTGENAPA
jgi:hypothetical protein